MSASPPSASFPDRSLPPEHPAPTTCRRCGSAALVVAYGYNYFWRCRDCGGSTPITVRCDDCGHKTRVRRRGSRYALDCPHCGGTTPLGETGPHAEHTS